MTRADCGSVAKKNCFLGYIVVIVISTQTLLEAMMSMKFKGE